jgi:4-hydroxy-2-oxoheptanedioate aldolase
MYQQVQVLEATEATPIVRIDELSKSRVQRILDAGATGIMFPQFKEKEEAELAVQSMYYPPRGMRGMARMVRATGFGAHAESYITSLDKTLINIIQIETVEAIRNIDSIASTDGVDVLFVGPNDLSLALGVFGQLEHPLYQQAIKSVSEAAKRTNKTAGVLLQDIREYEMYAALGYRFLGCGADAAFVSRGARDLVRDLEAKRKSGSHR